MPRLMHFVGSVPLRDPDEAMRSMLRWAGPHVRSIPDGETGDRGDWIVHIINSFREHPDFVLTRDGDFSSFDDIPRFRVKGGRKLSAENLDFGHGEYALASLSHFQDLRTEFKLPDLAFQVGIPGDLDLALFTFGPVGAFRYRGVFREVLGREIRDVHATAGQDVLFQLELPVELVFVTKMPAPLRSAMAAFLAGGVIRLVREAPAGARFGVHLCLGDLNHERLGKLTDLRPVVSFANVLARQWPAERALEYIHMPFTGGVDPIPLHQDFYRPLHHLKLPAGTRLVAGLVQETSSAADLRTALSLTEEAYGGPTDVAATCGLGRRAPEMAEKNSLLARELCELAGPDAASS